MKRKGRATRHLSLKGARIVFHNGTSSFDCIVRNMSDTGALLEIANSVGIPDHFQLYLDDGTPHRECAVKWRKEEALGVDFIRAADGTGANQSR